MLEKPDHPGPPYAAQFWDPSREMIDRGQSITGGKSGRLTWINSSAESAPLRPRYALITAAASLHWTDWGISLPRLRHALMPGAVLALIDNRCLTTLWDRDLSPAIARHSTNRAYRTYNLEEELTQRQLFRAQGRRDAVVFTFAQPLADYIESFHARNGFSRDRMTRDETKGFDSEVRATVAPYAPDGIVRLQIVSELIWVLPAPQTPLPMAPSGTGNHDPGARCG